MAGAKCKKVLFISEFAADINNLIRNYCKDEFPDRQILYDNYSINVDVDGVNLELSLTEIVGDQHLREMSYPNTDVIVLCFGVDRPQSLEGVQKKWIPEIKAHCPSVPIILVGTRKDARDNMNGNVALPNKEYIKREEGMRVARKIKAAQYLECSVQTTEGVDTIFKTVGNIALYVPRKKKQNCTLI